MIKLTEQEQKDLAERINSLIVSQRMLEIQDSDKSFWLKEAAKATVALEQDYGIQLPGIEVLRSLV